MNLLRTRLILAAWDRNEIDLDGVMSRLEALIEKASREPRPSRKQTHVGPMPVLWGEP